MNKKLSKSMMTRSKLKSEFNKNPIPENERAYKKQRIYNDLNPRILYDNKRFWKTVKPLFSNKQKSSNHMLVAGNVVITNEGKIAQILNTHFSESVKKLVPHELDNNKNHKQEKEVTEKNVKTIIDKYKDHPSILEIKETFNVDNDIFSFQQLSQAELECSIRSLYKNTGSCADDIPGKLLIQHCNIVSTGCEIRI